jgi:hypothetical protein
MFKTILVLALTFCMPAFAKRGQGGGGSGKKGNPACAPVRAACEKAGYKAGRGGGGGPAIPPPPAKGQSGDSPGTIRECLMKWASGGTIPGLMIRPSDPSAKDCAEHIGKMKEHGGPGGKGRRGGGPNGPGGPKGRPGYGNSAPHPAGPGAKATPPPAANGKSPAPMAPKNPNPAAPAVLPAVPTTPPPKKP